MQSSHLGTEMGRAVRYILIALMWVNAIWILVVMPYLMIIYSK